MKSLTWILAAFAAVLGLLFVAYRSTRPAVVTGATTATATGSAANVGASQLTNGTAQTIAASGNAISSVLGAIGDLFGDDDGATV